MITERDLPRVALLESRMSSELGRLVEKHGGVPVRVPAIQETPHLAAEAVGQILSNLSLDDSAVTIFMTGVAVSLLFEAAEQLGRRQELVATLRRQTTVCRGPKPVAALRGFGVPPSLTAKEPFTAAELLDAMAGLDIAGRRVLLFHYGERSETLAETLLARKAQIEEFWLYRWSLPDDRSQLEGLVRDICIGRVDALAITCQIQFRHLFVVAEGLERARELVQALNDKVVVAAVGPTCETVLRSHGVRVQVVPEHPKMGPLVMALMRHLTHRQRAGVSEANSIAAAMQRSPD